MAASARVYVGVFVFALIATLSILPITVMVLGGYQPPPSLPLVEPGSYSLGEKMAFTVASGLCVMLVVASWRLMLHGARLRQAVREERARTDQAVEVGGDGGPARHEGAREDERPPGYG